MTGFLAASALGLGACSGPPAPAPNAVQDAGSSDEMGEAHDQSSFGKDPAQMHLDSPDETDLPPPPREPSQPPEPPEPDPR